MAYTTIDDPTQFFNTIIWSGDSSSPETLTVGFQPDWIWGKLRNTAYSHQLYDSVRGFGSDKDLQASSDAAEGAGTADQYGYISGTTSTGFTATKGSDGGADGYGYWNESGRTYVAWNWKAGTTTGISGSPSITPSAYSFNQTPGFSIISYTGNGSVGATIPHGLGVAPAVIIFKNRDASVKWAVYHHKNTSAPETDHLVLNTNAATSDDDSILNDTAPSSTLITMKTSSAVNSNSVKYIAYCFSEIQGYSKFGSYTGNSSTDGPFLNMGFKPAFLMVKRTNTTENWYMKDNKRDPFNDMDASALYANGSAAEDTGGAWLTGDACANGFKIRKNDSSSNGSGSTYVYFAFAESPFVNSSGVPTNAR